jgi:hypothetical protein
MGCGALLMLLMLLRMSEAASCHCLQCAQGRAKSPVPSALSPT